MGCHSWSGTSNTPAPLHKPHPHRQFFCLILTPPSTSSPSPSTPSPPLYPGGRPPPPPPTSYSLSNLCPRLTQMSSLSPHLLDTATHPHSCYTLPSPAGHCYSSSLLLHTPLTCWTLLLILTLATHSPHLLDTAAHPHSHCTVPSPSPHLLDTAAHPHSRYTVPSPAGPCCSPSLSLHSPLTCWTLLITLTLATHPITCWTLLLTLSLTTHTPNLLDTAAHPHSHYTLSSPASPHLLGTAAHPHSRYTVPSPAGHCCSPSHSLHCPLTCWTLLCPRDEDSGSVGSCSPPPSPLSSQPPHTPQSILHDSTRDLGHPQHPYSSSTTSSSSHRAQHPGLTLSGLMGLPLRLTMEEEGEEEEEDDEDIRQAPVPQEAKVHQLDPGVAELLGSPGDEQIEALKTSQRFYLRLVQWLGGKRRTARSAEHHAKVHYGLRPETLRPDPLPQHDPKNARKKFADLLRRAARGGSWEEGRTLLVQHESGYSSPNISAQHTPTANHRLGNHPISMRRSLELSPQRQPPTRPRPSLPAEHLRRTLDGRFSVQAAEKRRRLSRGKTISQDEGFPPLPSGVSQTGSSPDPSNHPQSYTPVVTSARRMSRPGSSSREESTGEESGFEEEEPGEVRIPPLVLEERRDSGTSISQAREQPDPVAEFSIPWDQLQCGSLVRRGSTTNIYRGRWYGDVMIHTFDGENSQAEKRFWELVGNLSRIRHENIVLFMGACMKNPNLAMVTGVRRGMSLHNHTIQRGSIPYPSRVIIGRQVAQAMSYLHSRNIVHGHLNSRNVFLESKIKLSLLDHSMVESGPQRQDSGCIAQGLLAYLAPEMLRSLEIYPPGINVKAEPTQETDVYMYGTLLFEIFAETVPFSKQHPQIVIYQGGRGKQATTSHLQCTQNLKTLITECWSYSASERPVFSDVLKTLQKTLSLHRTHSTSEPERLNRIGITNKISC
ncbi:unnamed protein product, partial [Meganyctiphanes norvegica]